jgi:hypothetical protein
MSEFADLLRAIAALLWPIIALIVLWSMSEPLKNLLPRVQRWEGFGQKVELTTRLDELQVSTTAVSNNLVTIQEDDPKRIGKQSDELDEFDETARAVLEQASRSPKVALMELSFALEKRARHLLFSTGWHQGQTNFTLEEAIGQLSRMGGLASDAVNSFKLFNDVRAKIVHAAVNTNDTDILRAIDSGLALLKVLYSVPTAQHFVFHPGVAIYSDEGCTQLIDDAKGLLLETKPPGGGQRSYHIFPTTRTDYKKGEQVAWEWNSQRQWGSAWYRHPDTDKIEPAWQASMEFVGRDLGKI